MGVAVGRQHPAGAGLLVFRVQAQRFAQEGKRRDIVQQASFPDFPAAQTVGADRRGFAHQHLRFGDSRGLQPFIAGLEQAAVDARRFGQAFGVELGLQEGGVVGLVPDRIQRDEAGVVLADRRHEFLEVRVVGPGHAALVFVAGGRPLRHGRGHGQEHLPFQACGFEQQPVVDAPVVAGRVGRFEVGLFRAVRAWSDVGPVELDAQGFDAERTAAARAFWRVSQGSLRAGRGGPRRTSPANGMRSPWPAPERRRRLRRKRAGLAYASGFFGR